MYHLWNSNHNQDNKHFHPFPPFPPNSLVLLCNSVPPLCDYWSAFCHYHYFTFSRILYKWSHTICCPSFAWLFSLSINTLRFTHVVAHASSIFLSLLSSISLCGYTTVYSLLKGHWSWLQFLVVTKLLWLFMYKSLWGWVFYLSS